MAMALTVAACGGSGGGASSSDSDELKVMLSYKKSIYWLPLLVAEDRGYFTDEDLDVTFEETNGSGFVTQQLIAGNADAGWAGAPDAAVAAAKDDSLRGLMCNPPQNIFRIVVPADSDIQEVADLEGRTLGIPEAGGGEEPIINASLADAGLERDSDVTVLPIGDAGPASLNAILNGTVDAFSGSYPDISTLTADGRLTTRDITPVEYNAIPGDCLLVKRDALEDEASRTKLVGLARAWAKGAVFAAANPEAALEIACGQVPQECEDPAFAETYLTDTIALSGAEDVSTPFGAVDLSAWQTTFDVLRDSGAIKTDVDAEVFGGGTEITSFVADYWNFDADALIAEAKAG
jgi:NitT/TauT family transport system substrate-binding protein